MPDAWLLYDDVGSGHHPGYLDRIIDAVQRAGMRPIVASPTRPPSLMATEDWIEVQTRPLRAVFHNRRQVRRVAAIGRRMGATAFIDLYLDKNVWAAGALGQFDRRVHVLHHAEQYRADARRGWAGVRTAILRDRLKRMTEGGARVVVHTRRAAEILGDAVGGSRLHLVGYPVPIPPQNPRREPTDVPILLFTGAGRAEKGLAALVQALPLLEGRARLRVVGKQPPGLRDGLDPGESPVITWVDRRVTDEELWEEYQQAALAVLPYRQGFGDHGGPSSVLLETIGRGLPVVTTPALHPQLPSPGRGTVVADSDDPPDLARAIDFALASLERLSREAAETGPAFIARHHSYERYVEALATATNGP